MAEEKSVVKVSPSELAALYRCPRQYYYKFIKRYQRPTNYYATRGLAFHEAMQWYYESRQQKLVEPKPNEVTDQFVNSIESNKHNTEWVDTTPDKEIQNGIPTLIKYLQEVARFIDPLWIEKSFDVPFTGMKELMLKGRFDLIDKSIVLRDIKTKNKPTGIIDTYTHLQMSGYAYAIVKLIQIKELVPPEAFAHLVRRHSR